MLKTLRAGFLRLLRRMVGTTQILEQQQLFDWRSDRRQWEQTRLMLTLGNALHYSRADPEQVKTTALYRRCAEIISLLTPMDVEGGTFVRVGRSNDGGYVMLDVLPADAVDAAYGFGVSVDTSWDEAIAARGIDVYMFDHTVEVPPVGHPKCHPFKIGVTGYQEGPALRTLSALLAEHGHASSRRLIMKMDIEGCEWDVFDEADSAVIGQFSQFVVEFHGLTAAVHDRGTLSRYVGVLQKLNRTHQCIHVHANAEKLPLWVGPLVLPDHLEATYVRRADVEGRLTRHRRQFPTEIDEPSIEGWPDLYLGDFSVEDEPLAMGQPLSHATGSYSSSRSPASVAGTALTNTESRSSGGASS